MLDPVAMAERHAGVLAELAELGLAFARDARRDAEAAETPEERGRQALVFQRVSRSVRQSLALEARLVRDAVRAEREAALIRRKDDYEQVSLRKRQLKAGVGALSWREAEPLDDEDLEDFDEALDDVIAREALSDTFLAEHMADQVGRILKSLGYEVGPDGFVRRSAPPPEPPAEPPAEPDAYWRSSA